MKNTIHCLAIFLLWSVSTIAKAETQEAHVHGLATLTLALENDVLEIQFESPAANLIGFEHNARSPEEKQAVKQTETILKSPKRLFSFVGTNCKPTETTVDVTGVMGSKHDHHEHHNHSKGHDDSSHSEITANYRLSCKGAEKLNSIAIALFNQFPGIEKIKVSWVAKNRQGSELLFPDRNKISLR